MRGKQMATRSTGIVTWLASALLAAACLAPSSAAQPSISTSTATPASTPSSTAAAATASPVASAECVTIEAPSGEGPQTIIGWAGFSTDIVVANLVKIGGAKWNTPDGHHPSKAEAQTSPARLYRPTKVNVTQTIAGSIGTKQ